MDHACITVTDVGRSVKFYSDALGLKLLRVSVLNPNPQTKFKNAYMYSDTFLLELITAADNAARKDEPRTWQETLRGSVGITHLGMRVRDLDAAIKRVKAAGGVMIGEPFKVAKNSSQIVYVAKRVNSKIKYAKRPGTKPWRIAVFSDPDGVTIELVER